MYALAITVVICLSALTLAHMLLRARDARLEARVTNLTEVVTANAAALLKMQQAQTMRALGK